MFGSPAQVVLRESKEESHGMNKILSRHGEPRSESFEELVPECNK